MVQENSQASCSGRSRILFNEFDLLLSLSAPLWREPPLAILRILRKVSGFGYHHLDHLSNIHFVQARL